MAISSNKIKQIQPPVRRRPLFEPLESRIVLDAELSGFVFIDADGDGARDAGEIGVPGTVVQLTGTDTSGGWVMGHSSTGRYRWPLWGLMALDCSTMWWPLPRAGRSQLRYATAVRWWRGGLIMGTRQGGCSGLMMRCPSSSPRFNIICAKRQ